jgi:hypothetical protein
LRKVSLDVVPVRYTVGKPCTSTAASAPDAIMTEPGLPLSPWHTAVSERSNGILALHPLVCVGRVKRTRNGSLLPERTSSRPTRSGVACAEKCLRLGLFGTCVAALQAKHRRGPSPHARPAGPFGTPFATMENPHELVRTSYSESSKVYRCEIYFPEGGHPGVTAPGLRTSWCMPTGRADAGMPERDELARARFHP